MTSATQVVTELHADLARPQAAGQAANNPRPTLDAIRDALARFEQPADLANTRAEGYLINMRLIERHVTPRQETAARKHGRYARHYWKLTPRGYFFLKDLKARVALVPVEVPCRALVPYALSARMVYVAKMRAIFECYAPSEFTPAPVAPACPF